MKFSRESADAAAGAVVYGGAAALARVVEAMPELCLDPALFVRSVFNTTGSPLRPGIMQWTVTPVTPATASHASMLRKYGSKVNYR